MNETQAKLKVKAVAFEIAAAIGYQKAVELLKAAAREVDTVGGGWDHPGSR